MSTGIDTHEEPWLREALDSLLADEPAMSPAAVHDDVRRGAAARAVVHRRRAARAAAAALLVAVAAPVGLVLRVGSGATAPSASSTGSAATSLPSATAWIGPVPTPVPSVPPSGSSTTPDGGLVPTGGPTPVASTSSTAQTAAQVAHARTHPCAASDLVVTQPWHDGATGTNLFGIGVHNRSGTACGLVGFPSVRLLGATGPLPVAVRQLGSGVWLPESAPALLLAAGGDAHSLVTKFRCDLGTAEPARSLEVTVGGSTMTFPFTLGLCAGGAADPGNVLDVYGFYPGSG